jgi:dTDP-4-amino-4,6-dideoxygalactose transaminase
MTDLVSPSLRKQNVPLAIPFTKAYLTGNELRYITEALAGNHLCGNGPFTEHCHDWFNKNTGAAGTFLTHSGTSALEMAALLGDIQPGDEVIMPSFTFVTTASAFVMRGAVPVFIDIRKDNLNLDESLITKDTINAIARENDLLVIEDAAHAVLSTYKGKPLGGLGTMSAVSFHETKNIVSGEGGALLINDEKLLDRAFTIWEKGTNRREFFLGKVDKYTWHELGSSYLPSEMTAAFLWAQLQQAEYITQKRVEVWHRYHDLLQPLEEAGLLRRPQWSQDASINGHIYYILLPKPQTRDALLTHLSKAGVEAVFHYLPLHSSTAGQKFGREGSALKNTDELSACLLRFPIWVGLGPANIDHIVSLVREFFGL